MQVEIMLITIIAMIAVINWHFRRQPPAVRKYYLPALIFKLISGILLGLLYFYHYGNGDTIIYWRDGTIIADRMLEHPVEMLQFLWDDSGVVIDGLISDKPRSLFFAKISALIAIPCANNYWLMSLVISYLSFIGAWYLFKGVSSAVPGSVIVAAIAFLFFPSVVLWSSGIIKESIALSCIFFIAGKFLKLCTHSQVKWWEWTVGLVCIYIAWCLKYYWIGVLIPVLLTTFIVIILGRFITASKKFEIPLWIALFGLILLIGTIVHPNFYLSRFMEVVIQNNRDFIAISRPETLVHYKDLQPSLSSVMLNAPLALITGFFRPFIWEQYNLVSLLASVENMVLLFLAVTAIPSLRNFAASPFRLLTTAVIAYSVTLAVFLALSTPNFGTLSRYKIGFLPFFLFIILYDNKIVRKWTGSDNSGKSMN